MQVVVVIDPLIFSLNKALKIFTNDRHKAFNRLEETYKVLSDGLEKLGIELFLSSEVNKCRSLLAAYCPSYITFKNMKKIDETCEHHNFHEI